MSTPAFIIADLKSSDGVVLSTLSVMPKNFKTGSRGFYANQKMEMGGKRYQVQIQLDPKLAAQGVVFTDYETAIQGNLDPIALRPGRTRLADPGLPGSEIGQQHQPLAVEIESSGRIDALHGNKVPQAGAAVGTGELRQHAERLVEQDELHLMPVRVREIGT